MRTVNNLIDEAVNLCGGQAHLADRLGMPRQQVHELVRGKRTMTPCTVGLLCEVCGIQGEEAQRLAALATVSSSRESVRARLKRVFFLKARRANS